MAISINGNKSNSIHSAFWNALTKNSDSLALSQLWVCGINIDSLRNIGMMIDLFMPLYEPNAWSPDQFGVNSMVLNANNWDGVAPGNASSVYLWTRGASFTGDGLNISRVGVQQTGAIKGLIAESRTELSTTNITFLESNVSFVDGLLRPWSVLVGYRSLKDQSLRCDIELFALEKWSLYEPLRVRKSMLLRNAVPVSIDAEEYNYTGDKLIERQIQFAFDRYESRVYPDISNDSIKIMPEITKPTVMEQLQNILKKANELTITTQSIANDVTTTAAQGLNAVGLNKTADKVTNQNRRFQSNIITPVAKVISTGQQVVNVPQSVSNTIGKITGNNLVNADTVAEQIRQNNKPPQTP